MFTGIIESTGVVAALVSDGPGARLRIDDAPFAAEVSLGESIAVNGCCLTAAAIDSATGALSFDLLGETLRATGLGNLTAGDCVNLERALRAGDRMSGHYVQGHVDGVGHILDYSTHGRDHRLEIALPPGFSKYAVYKGSIAVDGISLTIAESEIDRVVLWIVPHTHAATNLRTADVGRRVNLEFDILAKYVERVLEAMKLR